MLSDLKFALRSLARVPGFTVAVILTLGLGLGANTAIFSVIRGVLLKPLPHRDGDRLIYLRQSLSGIGGENILFSVPEINDLRAAKTLGGIAEYSAMAYSLLDTGDPVRINVGLVTGNYFSVMGLSPILGRLTNPGDDGTTVPPVMVLTYEFWMKRFGGDRGVVGRTVRLGGKPVTIIGVVQPAPYFPVRMDAILNMVISEHHSSALMIQGRTHRMTEMIARLAPGATVQQARAEIAAIRKTVLADHPEAYDKNSNPTVTVTPFKEVLGEHARVTLWLLMGAAAFVLIIACANVANLTLMRGVRREQELMIRTALGAGAAALRKLLLAENLVLALLGGVLGLVVAYGGVGLLRALAERYSPRANEITVDATVLGFALLMSVVVAVLLSFAPRVAHELALGAGMAGAGKSTATRSRQRLQRSLVVAQIAVSVILLTGAGLLVRTMQRLAEVDDGLNAPQVLTMDVQTDFDSSKDDVARMNFEAMRDHIAAMPGVTDVGLGSTMPLRSSFQLEVKAEGRPLAPNEPVPRADYRTASPEYFKAAGIPLLKGREFNSTDRKGSASVVILNKALADRLFPNADPIGQRVAWTGEVLKFLPISPDWRTVVGVVGDTKDDGLDAGSRPVMFQPFDQVLVFGGGLVIRAQRDAMAMAPGAMREVHSVSPTSPIEDVLTVDQIRDQSIAPRRLNAVLIAIFGALAVVIAAVGIAGVLAFSVSARTNEIGIRMALGADRAQVQRMVLGEGGVLLLGGLALGVLGSWVATRSIQSVLYGVPPHDPVTMMTVALVMLLVGMFACWIPAMRAARIDPLLAMKAQ